MLDPRVQSWLEGLNLDQYIKVFADSDIDFDVLEDLTETDLEKLGVSLGHRKRLLRAIAARSEGAESPLQTPADLSADGERSQLTVMFCDLVGSTALSTQFDPEDLRDVIRAYQDSCAAVVARYDGFVAKFMGDGVLVYFGYPQAHENDAERAISTGLEIVEAVRELEYDLSVRVGIATGLVVVGDIVGEGASQEAAITGETPNLAARLQDIAEPNSVALAATTHTLAGGLFEYADQGEKDFKGFTDPVRVWSVTGVRKTETRFDATRAAELTELVGRDEEVETLLRRWQRAKAGEGQVVLISGEPGIGKSRVASEFQARIGNEPHIRLNDQCSPFHTNSALYPVIERLARAAGFEVGESMDARLDKLEAMLGRSGQPMETAVPLFADLLSVPLGDRYPALQIPPPARKQVTLKALAGQIAGMAAQMPVLFVFEDAHWIDPTTLELLELIVEQAADIPVLVLITHRPEFQAPWVDRPRVTAMLLGRLEHAQCARLVESVDGNTDLDGELRRRIVDQADGVPLFVEELTRSVLEIARDTPDEVSAIDVPATLKDSLEARLDRLGTAKEIALIGSVIGRAFGYALISRVAGLADGEMATMLDQLVQSGLVLVRGQPPEAVYTFKHALVQDTAYGMLLRSRRAELHAAIGEAIESAFPETAETEPELLARHFAEAGNREKGAAYWLMAGRIALRRSSFQEAVAQLQNGLKLVEVLPEGPERFGLELGLSAALAPAIRASMGMGHPEAARVYEQAYELSRRDAESPHTFPLLWGLWHIRWSQGNMRSAVGHAEELLTSAEASGDTDHLLISHCSLAIALWHNGNNQRVLPHIEEALALYDPKTHPALAYSYFFEFGTFAQILLGLTQFSMGKPDTAIETAEKAVEVGRTLNQPHSLGFTLIVQAFILTLRRDIRAALSNADECLAAVGAGQSRTPFVIGIGIFRGWALALSGNRDEGIQLLQHSIELWKQTGAQYLLPFFGTLLAETYIACGQLDEASALADAELSRIEQTGQDQWISVVLCTKGDALIAMENPDEAEAERCFRQAIDVAGSQSAKSWELRAATCLARLWQSQGKSVEAGELLTPVYEWFTEGFDTADLKEAKALLDEFT